MEKLTFADGLKYRSDFTIVTYVIPREKISVTSLTLACRLLTHASGRYRTRRELALACSNLYGARVTFSYSVSRANYYLKASIQTTSSRYLKVWRNLYPRGLKLLSGLLRSSWSRKEEDLAYVKNQLYKNTQDLLQDPNYRAEMGFVKNFAQDTFLEEILCPDLEEIGRIQATDIDRAYEVILSSPSFIVAVGDDGLKAEKLIARNFEPTGGNFVISPIDIKEQEVRDLADHGDYSQSIIHCAYRIPSITNTHEKVLFKIANFILGNSSSSVLFGELREKNALCYYAQSSRADNANILFIDSGIESGDYRRTLKMIDNIIGEIQDKVTSELVSDAKVAVTRTYLKVDATPESLGSFMHSNLLSGLPIVAQEHIEELKNITKDEVADYLGSLIKIGSFSVLGDGAKGEN